MPPLQKETHAQEQGETTDAITTDYRKKTERKHILCEDGMDSEVLQQTLFVNLVALSF